MSDMVEVTQIILHRLIVGYNEDGKPIWEDRRFLIPYTVHRSQIPSGMLESGFKQRCQTLNKDGFWLTDGLILRHVPPQHIDGIILKIGGDLEPFGGTRGGETYRVQIRLPDLDPHAGTNGDSYRDKSPHDNDRRGAS